MGHCKAFTFLSSKGNGKPLEGLGWVAWPNTGLTASLCLLCWEEMMTVRKGVGGSIWLTPKIPNSFHPATSATAHLESIFSFVLLLENTRIDWCEKIERISGTDAKDRWGHWRCRRCGKEGSLENKKGEEDWGVTINTSEPPKVWRSTQANETHGTPWGELMTRPGKTVSEWWKEWYKRVGRGEKFGWSPWES